MEDFGRTLNPPVGRLAERLRFLPLTIASCGILLHCSSTPAAPAPPPAPPPTPGPDAALPVDAFPPPVDASPPPVVDAAKPCGTPGKLDVEPRLDGRYRGTQVASPEVNVRLVDACLGSVAPVRGAGIVRVSPSTGAAFYVRVESVTPGYYPSASEIWNFEYPDLRADVVVPLISQGALDPQLAGSPVPDPFAGVFNPSKAHFLVEVDPVGACDTGGYQLTVVDHPEARISYGGSTFTPEPSLEATVTSDVAFAFISNVNPGPGALEVAGKRGACHVAPPTLVVPVNTGKYPIIAGTVTRVQLVSTAE